MKLQTLTQGLPFGLPLLTALLQDVTPDVRMRLDGIGKGATKRLFFRPQDDVDTWYYRHKFERDFEKKLESGELIGTGKLSPPNLVRTRQTIPSELWRYGHLNYEESSLRLDEREYTNIEIFSAKEFSERGKRKTAGRSSTKMGTSNSSQVDITFSEDGELKIGSDTFKFRGQKQRTFIELLVESYLDNQVFKTASLLEKAGFSWSTNTLGKAFKRNKSWERLKPYIAKDHGCVWLQHKPNVSEPSR